MDKFTATHWYNNPSSKNEQKDVKLATYNKIYLFKNLLKILAVLRRTDFCIAATILFGKLINDK